MNFSRYWHTLKHLRSSQIVGRLWFRAYHPQPDLRQAPPRRATRVTWQEPAWREPSLLGPATARYLDVTAGIDQEPAWSDDRRGRLWLYNLHYFDDVTARDADQRRAWHRQLARRWMAENPPGHGPGWEPYPTSLRIVNWIKWVAADPAQEVDGLLNSLAVQTRWLGRRLEVHLLANHLWANAKALLMAGTFFEGPEADRWRRRGLRVLMAELDEQVLPDGGHFERSPMYHAIVLEDVLDLLQLNCVFPEVLPEAVVVRLKDAADRMLRWLRVMSHPDGELSFFNDAAFLIAAPIGALEARANAMGLAVDGSPLPPICVMADSGYVRLQGPRAVVLCDVGPVGPDYQPGHAHADTLSFELSVDGHRVVVNGGTSTYTPGPARLRQRSTAAHSTVEVDGHDSSDVWGAFRVGRRARPFDVRTGQAGAAIWAEAAHDGYRHRPGGVVHRRRWTLDDSGLEVRDMVEGAFTRAVARFILHPSVIPAANSPVSFITDPPVHTRVADAEWHPRFGHCDATRAIEAEFVASPCVTRVSWQ